MAPNSELNIERRRLQNRLAQRRFRERRSQQKAAGKRAPQERPQVHVDSQGDDTRTMASPPPPASATAVRSYAASPLGPAALSSRDMHSLQALVTLAGTDSIMWCRLGGNNILLECVTSLDFNSNPNEGLPESTEGTFMSNAPPSSPSSTEPAKKRTASTQHEPVPSQLATPDFGKNSTNPKTNGGSPAPSRNSDSPPTTEANPNSWRPLHLAAHKGHAGIVNTLLRYGGDSNERDSDGMTPLMHAIASTNTSSNSTLDIARSLLAHGARLDVTDGQKRSALHWAVAQRREDVLALLLEHCVGEQRGVVAESDVNGKTPLLEAVDTGFEEGVKVLLGFGVSAVRT